MQRFALELFRQAAHFRNVLLQVDEVRLSIGCLAFQSGDILQQIIDVAVQSVILVFVTLDLLLEDRLLTLELLRVSIEFVNLPTSCIIIPLQIFGTISKKVIVLSNTACSLIQSQLFIE